MLAITNVERGGSTRRGAAAICLASALLVGSIVASAEAEPAGPSAPSPRTITSTSYDRFDVSVSVSPTAVGPIDVRIAGVRLDDERNDLHARLVFTNGARRTAIMKDVYRTSAFARGGTGDQLLVADEGCGYYIDNRGDPVHPGVCNAYLDWVELAPGGSGTRKLTVFKGLPGMTRLSAGHYEFTREVKFRFVKSRKPPAAKELMVSLDVTQR